MKKKPTPPPKTREQHKLKLRLALRERQFQKAVRALKDIIEFKSAHLSVFETEVHELQRTALQCLCECESLQSGKPLRAIPIGGRDARAVQAQLRARFPGALFRPLYPGLQPDGSVEDE
jgi:hypothetical protein